MATTATAKSGYSSLVVQQVYDARPSPSLEVSRTLDPADSYSPGLSSTSTEQQQQQQQWPQTHTPLSEYPQTARAAVLETPAKVHAPPCTPITSPTSTAFAKGAQESSITTTTSLTGATAQQQQCVAATTPLKTHQKTPSTSSPRGVSDVYSYSLDKQLAEQYTFVEEIGYGNWGSVWKIQQRHRARKIMATKLVFRTKEDKTTPARVRSIWQEFKVIRNFKKDPHPNIIRFYDFILTPSYALVTMDIHGKLMPTHIAEVTARAWFKALLSAVDYLHIRGVSHNDIKPANILLSYQDEPIIVDFGFANQWSLSRPEDAAKAFQTDLSWGTPEYLAPERAIQSTHDERLSDIWSLGVTMYEIVVGRTPFEKDESEEFLTKEALQVYYNRTLSGTFLGSYKLSLAFEDLIRQMVEPSAAARMPTCGRGLKHPFFSLRPPSVLGGEARPTSLYSRGVPDSVPTFKIEAAAADKSTESLAIKAPLAAASPNKAKAADFKINVAGSTASKAAVNVAKPAVTAVTANVEQPNTISMTSSASSPPVKRKPALTGSPSKKARNEIKIFKDPAPVPPATTKLHVRNVQVPSTTFTGNSLSQKEKSAVSSVSGDTRNAGSNAPSAATTGNGKPGLRPLLLRTTPDAAQCMRAPLAKPLVESAPLMSTPKKFGNATNTWAVSANSTDNLTRNLDSRSSMRSNQATPRKEELGRSPSSTHIRDSKELRSPESIKTPRSARALRQEAVPRIAKVSPYRSLPTPIEKDSPPAPIRPLTKSKSTLSAFTASQKQKEASPPPFTANVVPVPSHLESATNYAPSDKKSRLSKKRPSMKSQKSSSAISFTSLSSSFKGVRGKSLDGRQYVNQDLEGGYAIVERDGRISFDGAAPPFPPDAQQQVDIHIRNPESEKQEIIQERIISPELQRAYGESVQQEVAAQRERRFLTRSNSLSSAKYRAQNQTTANLALSSSQSAKIRKSKTPSFTGDAYSGIVSVDERVSSTEELDDIYRADSRQSNWSSEYRSDSRQSNFSAVTYGDSENRAGHQQMPSITVSNTHSSASHSTYSKNIRSCWSPETVPPESTVESDYGDEQTDREAEGDDTIHAAPAPAPVPEIRRTSGVFTRAPRAESIYQSFICASPTVEIPASPRSMGSQSPQPPFKPRSDSLSASTWSHSSRQMLSPTPDALREYTRLPGVRDCPSPFTLFPPPEDLRGMASPPPRPETSQSRKTISKMKSFFGRLGFGRQSRDD